MDVIFFQLFYCCRSWKTYKSYNLQNERSSLWFLYVRIMNYNLVDLKSESQTNEILCSRLRKKKTTRLFWDQKLYRVIITSYRWHHPEKTSPSSFFGGWSCFCTDLDLKQTPLYIKINVLVDINSCAFILLDWFWSQCILFFCFGKFRFASMFYFLKTLNINLHFTV